MRCGQGAAEGRPAHSRIWHTYEREEEEGLVLVAVAPGAAQLGAADALAQGLAAGGCGEQVWVTRCWGGRHAQLQLLCAVAPGCAQSAARHVQSEANQTAT